MLAQRRTIFRGPLHRLLCGVAILLASQSLLAQPQWRFHLAFEDGTGARDTLWMVYDTDATVGSLSMPLVDDELAEGAVDMDVNAFNVWTPNWNNDSTKTVAWPYTQFPWHDAIVEAFNYELPVTIRWDRSLLDSESLPTEGGPLNGCFMYNNFFAFFFSNCNCGVFDMTVTDSVTVWDTGPESLFPFSVTTGHYDDTGITNNTTNAPLRIWPNPVHDRLFLSGIDGPSSLTIHSALGVRMWHHQVALGSEGLDVTSLPAGIYVARITNATNHHYHVTFIKED